MSNEANDRACQSITGGGRCGITTENGLNEGNEPDGWWVGFSPRNGLYASVEGDWSDWVTLARNIIAEDDRRKSAAAGKPESEVTK